MLVLDMLGWIRDAFLILMIGTCIPKVMRKTEKAWYYFFFIVLLLLLGINFY